MGYVLLSGWESMMSNWNLIKVNKMVCSISAVEAVSNCEIFYFYVEYRWRYILFYYYFSSFCTWRYGSA